ncbi:MAG: diaminopimelate epimerase [Bacteroidales bacterium]|jgi:diaminopimelate epimerase|nr:diaminopimelate epimerase [Bacteroidales bacterium]
MKFYKYHGTGNDFIIVDNRNISTNISQSLIKKICNRRFGIGADGLMFLNKHNSYDFEMQYFNSDGKEGTMCGNGGRCIVAFAKKLNIIRYSTTFIANDGIHKAIISDNNNVELEMQDVKDITKLDNGYFLNTGSPHYVIFSKNINKKDVNLEGEKNRNSDTFKPEGTNVNFVELNNNQLFVRTFERGVEEETLSCGTGVTASALAAHYISDTNIKVYKIKTLGGNLEVSFDKKSKKHFTDIKLKGPAEFIFEGQIEIQ